MSTFPCNCAASTDVKSKWFDQHNSECAIFECGACGGHAYVAPQGNEPTYCTKCCPDHEYQYERGEGWRCLTCYAEPPDDWYQED